MTENLVVLKEGMTNRGLINTELNLQDMINPDMTNLGTISQDTSNQDMNSLGMSNQNTISHMNLDNKKPTNRTIHHLFLSHTSKNHMSHSHQDNRTLKITLNQLNHLANNMAYLQHHTDSPLSTSHMKRTMFHSIEIRTIQLVL